MAASDVQQIGLHPTNPATAPSSPSFFDQFLGFGIILVIIGVIICVVVLVIRWLFTKKTKGRDIFANDVKKVMELCKMQKDPDYLKPAFPGLPLFFGSRGIDIIVNYPPLNTSRISAEEASALKDGLDNLAKSCSDDKEKPEMGQRVFTMNPGRSIKFGTYAGHCYTMDGTCNVLMKSRNLRVMGIFPTLVILKLRMKYEQKIPNPKDRTLTSKIKVLPDLYRISKDMITVDCLGFDKIGPYLYCVNMTDDQRIVDTRAFAYQDQIELSNAKIVMDMARNFSVITDDLAKSNPLALITRETEGGLMKS